MPVANLYFRLRIRNAADSADDLVVSSVRNGTNPYLTEPPSGDGQSVDPLTGKVTTGEYSFLVIDAETAASTRMVTSKLADANARQQLISRRAYGETSPDGTTWTILIPGYVTAVRLIDGITFSVTLGHTRRVEQSREIFNVLTPLFNRGTSFAGGPVMGGDFVGVRDRGGWKARATQVNLTFDYVQLKIRQGFNPRNFDGWDNNMSTATANYTNSLTRPYFEPSEVWMGATTPIQGWFPGITIKLLDSSLNVVGYFTPLSDPESAGAGPWWDPDGDSTDIVKEGSASFFVHWSGGVDAAGDPIVGVPTVGDDFFLYAYINTVSEDSPLHISDHPVDIWAALMDEAEIDYDASVLTAVKAEIGNDALLTLRITKSYKLADFIQSVIFGPFGLGTRIDDGVQVLFTTRKKLSAAPAVTITLDDLRSVDGTVFEVDESTVVTKITLKQDALVAWRESDEDDKPPSDAVRSVTKTQSLENSDDDTPATGEREISFEIPGFVGILPLGAPLPEIFILEMGEEIFDVWGRGAIEGETFCLPSVDAKVGELRIANFIHLPGAVVGASPVSQRNATRILRAVSRTETPEGPDIRWIDWGAGNAASATLPTFTVTENATDNRYVDIALTNAGALAALGVKVRIDLAVSTLEPAAGIRGIRLATIDPAVTTSIISGPYDLGSKVWVQMRTEKLNTIAGAYTAWTGLQLDTIPPPTGLTATAEDSLDVSRRTLNWTNGTADIPVEVRIRLTADPASSEIVLAFLAPGTTTYEITGLTSGTRTALVRHRETPPSGGFSTSASVSVVTTGAGADSLLAPPTAPEAFSISGDPIGNPNYALEVVAGEFPSSVQIWEKVSLSGTYVLADTIAAVAGPTVTRWENYVAYDGQVRYLKARHTLAGSVPSEFTEEVSVIPGASAGILGGTEYIAVPVQDEDGSFVYDEGGSLVMDVYEYAE